MKKALLILAAVLTTMAASAQFEIGLGGSFGIPSYTSKIGGTETIKDAKTINSSFNIMPTIGFRLDEAMSLGAFFEYSSQTSHAYRKSGPAGSDPVQGDNQVKISTLGGGFFFRYNVVSYGDIRIFFEFQGHFAVGSEINGFDDNGEWIDNDKYELTAMRFGFVPGASYQITDNISFDVYFNFATLGYSMLKSTHTETRSYADPTDAVGTYGPIDSSLQTEDGYSMFGFGNFNDYTNTDNYNLGTAIGLKLNVNF